MKNLFKQLGLSMSFAVVLTVGVFVFSNNAAAQGSRTPTSGVRYANPNSKIYIKPHTSKSYRKLIKQAVSNWNATQTFHWTISKKKAKTSITVTNSKKSYWKKNQFAGVTFNSVYNYPSNRTQAGAHIYVNSRIMSLFHYNKKQRLMTIEHEMGHAMGLAHSRNHASIMYPSDRYYNRLNPKIIPAVDVSSVNSIYNF